MDLNPFSVHPQCTSSPRGGQGTQNWPGPTAGQNGVTPGHGHPQHLPSSATTVSSTHHPQHPAPSTLTPLAAMPLCHPFLLPQIPYSAKPLNCPAFSRRTLQWPHSPSPDLISRRHHRLSSKMKDGIHLTNRPYGTGMQAGRHGCKGLPCADCLPRHTVRPPDDPLPHSRQPLSLPRSLRSPGKIPGQHRQ